MKYRDKSNECIFKTFAVHKLKIKPKHKGTSNL